MPDPIDQQIDAAVIAALGDIDGTGDWRTDLGGRIDQGEYPIESPSRVDLPCVAVAEIGYSVASGPDLGGQEVTYRLFLRGWTAGTDIDSPSARLAAAKALRGDMLRALRSARQPGGALSTIALTYSVDTEIADIAAALQGAYYSVVDLTATYTYQVHTTEVF